MACGPPVVVDLETVAAEVPRRPGLPRSPIAIAAAICTGLFVAFVAVVELAS